MNTSNITEQRMADMQNTLGNVQKEYRLFKRYLTRYKLYEGDNLNSYCLHLLQNRMDKQSVRAYFCDKVYEYFRTQSLTEKKRLGMSKAQEARLFHRIVPFLAEVVIVIQYLHNQILDGKYQVIGKDAINRNLIASNILREVVFEYVEQEAKGYPSSVHGVLSDHIRKTLLCVDLGQRLEMEYGHYAFFSKQKTHLPIVFSDTAISKFCNLLVARNILGGVKEAILPVHHNFVELYFRRIYLTNTSLFVLFAELVADLYRVPAAARQQVSDFSTCYGLALQVVNDIMDFVPPNEEIDISTVGKKSTDAFSDLRNGNITLPLIFHLSEVPNRLVARYLKTQDLRILRDMSHELVTEMVESGALRQAKEVGLQLANQAQGILTDPPATVMLNDMLDIAKHNKYYYQLRKKFGL